MDVKTSKSIKRLFENYFWFIHFAICFIFYWPIYSNQNLVDIDYHILNQVLENISSMHSYYTSLKVLDVQPFRDLIIVMTHAISEKINFNLYGFVNVVTWFFTTIIFKKITNYFFNPTISGLLTLIVLLHPIPIWVTSWPSALKHLLAVFFISLATLYSIYYKSDYIKKPLLILITYMLAILSHPIVIFWPLFFFIYTTNFKKINIKLDIRIFLIFTMFIFLFLNYFYYSHVYPLQLGVEKISHFAIENYAKNILGLSRSLTQILFPHSFAQFYSESNKLNLLGLLLSTALFIIAFFKYKVKKIIIFTTFLLIPFLTIYIRETNIFVSDTYLLLPLLTLTFIIGHLIFRISKNMSFIILPFFLFLLFLKSNFEINYAISTEGRYRISYEREPNCRNALAYTNQLLYLFNLAEFRKVGKQALNNRCILLGANTSQTIINSYATLIYLEEGIKVDDKISKISSLYTHSAVTLALLSKLYFQNKKPIKSQSIKTLYKSLKLDKKSEKLIEQIELSL